MNCAKWLVSCLLSSSVIPARATALAQSSPEHAATAARSAEFARDVEAELEVKRARTGHLLVRPALDGHEAGWFIFDTGAGICVLSTPKADELGLASVGAIQAAGVGVGDASMSETLRAEILELGPLTLRDVPLMKTDLGFLREHLGVEVSGVIGHSLFAQCIVELDLAAPRIALHDPAHYALSEGEWSPLTFRRLIPSVKAIVEEHECTFHLDIGSNSGITFEHPAVERLGLLAGRTVTDAKFGGVGGFIAAKRGKVTSLELGGARFTDVEALFAVQASAQSGHGHDGSLGTRVLERYRLTLDYGGQRICFRPTGS